MRGAIMYCVYYLNAGKCMLLKLIKVCNYKPRALFCSPRSRNLSDSLCVEAVALGTNKPIVAMRDIDWLYFCLAM